MDGLREAAAEEVQEENLQPHVQCCRAQKEAGNAAYAVAVNIQREGLMSAI